MTEDLHDDAKTRDLIIGQIGQTNAPNGSNAHALMAAAIFSLAHQVGRIATVLEGLTPLIELGLAEARKDARG